MNCARFGFRCFLFSVAFCVFYGSGSADTWAPVPSEISARNGKFILHVTPAAQLDGPRCIATMSLRVDTEVENIVWRKPLINSVCPLNVLISENGRYTITFDDWAQMGYGDSVVAVYGPNGETIRQFGLEQLLSSEDIRRLPTTSSSRWWRRGEFIDDKRGLLFIAVAETSNLLCIGLASGHLRLASDQDLALAIRNGKGDELCLPIEIAGERRVNGLTSVYCKILEAPQFSTGVRLRAAAALCRQNDKRGRTIVEAVSLGHVLHATDLDQALALRLLPDFIGVNALPVLRSTICKIGDNEYPGIVQLAVQETFVRLGEDSLPILIEMLKDEHTPSPCRISAIKALSQIDSKNAVSALLEAAESNDACVAENAIVSACSIAGQSEIAASFCRLLHNGKSQDVWLVSCFNGFHYPDLVPILVGCLERHLSQPDNDLTINQIVRTLEYQTGMHFGRDLQKWHSWLENNGTSDKVFCF